MWSGEDENGRAASSEPRRRKENRVMGTNCSEADNPLWSDNHYYRQSGQSGSSSRAQETMEVDGDSQMNGHMSRRQIYLEGRSSSSTSCAQAASSSYNGTSGQTEWTTKWAGPWRSSEPSNRRFNRYKSTNRYYTPRTPSGSPPSSPTATTEHRNSAPPSNQSRGDEEDYVTCKRGRVIHLENRPTSPTYRTDGRSIGYRCNDHSANYSTPSTMADIHERMENMEVQNRDASSHYRRVQSFPILMESEGTFRDSVSRIPHAFPESHSAVRVSVKRKRRVTSTLTSERSTESEPLERGKAQDGSNGAVDLKSEVAVNMPLDELISQNSISRPRRSSFLFKQGSRRLEKMECSDQSSYNNDADDDSSDEQEQHSRKRHRSVIGIGRKSNNSSGLLVVIDGSSVGFDYGEKLHFDWKGIQICVEHFVNLRCSIVVVVPEERVKTKGMSKNEDLIHQLQKYHYLKLSWENHDDALFSLKFADNKKAIIISNDVWKRVKTRGIPRLEELKNKLHDRTFGFQFGNKLTETIRFPKNEAGLAVEDFLIGWK